METKFRKKIMSLIWDFFDVDNLIPLYLLT